MLIANPELVRYARSQMRKGKVTFYLTIYVGFLVILFITNLAFLLYNQVYGSTMTACRSIFLQIMFAQMLVVCGGAAKVSTDMKREQIEKTIEFVRITPLNALQIALGRILGSPVLTYALIAGGIPLSLIAAIGAGISTGVFLGCYLLLLSSSLLIHSASAVLAALMKKQATASKTAEETQVIGGLTTGFGAFSVVVVLMWWVVASGTALTKGRFPETIFQMTVPFFATNVNLAATVVLVFLYLTGWNMMTLGRWIQSPAKPILSKKQSFFFFLVGELLCLGILWNFFPQLGKGSLTEGILLVFLLVSLLAIPFLLSRVAPNRIRYLAGEIRKEGGESGSQLLWDESTLILPLSLAKIGLASVGFLVLLVAMRFLGGRILWGGLYLRLSLAWFTWFVSIVAWTLFIQTAQLDRGEYGTSMFVAILFFACLGPPLAAYLLFRGWDGMSGPAHFIASFSPPYAIYRFFVLTKPPLPFYTPFPALLLHAIVIPRLWKMQALKVRKAKAYLANPDGK